MVLSARRAREQGGRGRPRRPLALALTAAVVSAAALGTSAAADPAAAPITASDVDAADWSIGDPRIPTPWTDDVSPENALPEYPRPQLTRERWENLNGLWEFAEAEEGEEPAFGTALEDEILVPYPVESALSGVQEHMDRMFYRRTFEVPDDWRVRSGDRLGAERLILHFGAVDYDAKVWVNGELVAEHRGGYSGFEADITDALTAEGPQELVVWAEDLTDATFQPVGKQVEDPDRGIFYEPASGIWQTVWMEPVPRSHVTEVGMTPDLDTESVTVNVAVADADAGRQGINVAVAAYDDGELVGRVSGAPGEDLSLPVPDPNLWTPDNPHLYDLKVWVRDGNRRVEEVESYVGMREVGMAEDADGKLRMTLNGEFVFHMSTLDQGYWPDGIYTAPTDEALRFDLEAHKELGFNTVRKHIKVEPDRWYYHADQLGLLVWQDMPSPVAPHTVGGARPTPEWQEQFEVELADIVDDHKNWTSVVGWVPFNEGWGEWDVQATARIADEVKEQDPSRLVNAHSGFNCCDSLGDPGAGDILDWHQYTGPASPQPDATRAAMDGEHGGFGLEVEDHMWFGQGHAYEMTDSAEELTRRYVENQEDLLQIGQQCGISGGVYTQITDVEHEVNGLLTYDRQLYKMDVDAVRDINRRIIDEVDGSGSGGGEPDPGTPGLGGVSAYPFSEGSGTSTEDVVGDNDATLVGGAGWTEGVEGSALSLSGDGQFADTGASIVDTTGSYSVSAWVRLDEVGDGFQTAVSQDGSGASAFFLQYSARDQAFAFSFATGPGAIADEPPTPGQWYHLTGVRDAGEGTLTLYVDGEQAGSDEACFAGGSDGNTVIGRAQFNGNEVDFVDGAVDDVRIFDRALDADEVAELAAGGGQD